MYNISPTKESRCPHPLFRYHIHVRETDGVIQDGQSRETGNIGYTRRRQSKQKKHNTTYVEHNYAQTNTNNVNKT
jgi:hypothetical protein